MNRQRTLLLLFFLILTFIVRGQYGTGNSEKLISPTIFSSDFFACNITVDAGDDTLICEGNFPIQLNGSFVGNAINYFWSPGSNVSDSFILNPIANSFGAYTLTVELIDDQNLVVNSDFENGDTGFTTDYSTGAANVGNYLISDTPQDYFNLFTDCGDHTTGMGNMMIVDGSDIPDQNIWCQNITISANTDYYFSLWATMVGGISPPDLFFTANGNSIGDTSTIPFDNCLWTEISTTWNSGTETSVEFCIINNNTSPLGNDFAIDDILVSSICEVTDEMEILILEAEAIVADSSILCFGDCIVLDGSASTSGLGISYEWTSMSGGIIQNDNILLPTVCDTGTYQLKVISFDVTTNLTCLDSTIISVSLETLNPEIPIFTGLDTICIGDSSQYKISFPDTSTTSYDWFVTNGIILAGQDSTIVEVEWSGISSGEICVAAINSCATSDTTCRSIIIISTPQEPMIFGPTNICNNTITTYSIPFSNDISNYQWSVPIGTIIQSGEGTEMITMDWGSVLGGDICLVAKNNCGANSSCISVVFGSILIDLDSLNSLCPTDDNGWIKVSPLAGTAPFSFLWGNGEMTDSIGGLSAGTYQVTVSDTDGCSTEETITLQDPATLNLTFSNTQITCNGACDGIISAEVTGGTAPYSFLWGNNLGTNDSLINVCDGIYNITITDANGCTLEGQTQLNDPPLISAVILNDTIICQGESINIEFQFSGIGPFEVELSDGSVHPNLIDGEVISITPLATSTISITNLIDQGQPNCSASSASFTLVTVNNPPALPIISGSDSTCQNTILNYCITNIAMVDSFHWTIPIDANFTGQHTDCIEIDWTNSNGGQVCVEAINECGSTQECMDVTLFPIPTSTFSVDPIICIDSTSTINYNGTASANAIFTWDFDGGNIISGNESGPFEIDWDIAGDYNITLTVEENGCQSALFSQNVQVDASLAIPNITCESTTQSITFLWDDIAGATDFLINELSGINGVQNGNSIVYNNLLPGQEIAIEVTAVGNTICGNATVMATCFANDCPNVELVISPIDDVCLTNLSPSIPLQVAVNGSDGTGVGNWSGNGIVNDVFDPNIAGEGQHELIYSFTEIQCDFSISTFVNVNLQPIVEAGEDGHLDCGDTLIVLDGSNSSVFGSPIWTTNNGNIVNGFNSLSAEVNAPGVYYLTIENSVCTSIDSVVVTQNISIPIAAAGLDIELDCNETEAILGSENTSSGINYEYIWTSNNPIVTINSPTDLNPIVDGIGTYNLLITNLENGCTSTDEIQVSQSQNIPQNINLEITESSCHGDDQGIIMIPSIDGGLPPYLFSLNGSPFSSLNIYNGLSVGIYDILIQDANGCELSTMITLNQPDSISIDLGGDIYLELGDSVMLDPLITGFFDTIIWASSTDYSNCDTLENCFFPIVTPTQTAQVMATIMNDDDCIAMDQITIFVEKNRYVYIPNAFAPEGNSGNQIFMIYVGKGVKKINTFKVFSRWGEQLYETRNFYPNDNSYGWDGNFNGRKMKAGVYVYFVEIEFSDGLKIIYKGDVTLTR